jgi:hypothetical protein
MTIETRQNMGNEADFGVGEHAWVPNISHSTFRPPFILKFCMIINSSDSVSGLQNGRDLF